jgi:hypothetical protein
MSRKPKVGSFSIAPISQEPEKKTVASLLEPYKQQEFIPHHIIQNIVQTAFPNSSILHSYSPIHHIIKVTINDLLVAPISNWEFNRPADPLRCENIAQYYIHSKKPVDQMIYLTFNNKTQSFDTLDGIHRITALKLIQEKSTHLDFISSNEYNGEISWLLNSFIIFNIRFNATTAENIDVFQSLNKSNPIPDLYVRDVAKDKRDCIQTLAIKWQNRYKLHFSASTKPQKPNINRDRFMDVLDSVYDKYNLREDTKHKLEQMLEKANLHISNNIPKKITAPIREKCSATGCWLFLYSPDELVAML